MSEEPKQNDVEDGLPTEAPAWASEGARAVYAANRQYFVDLENTAGDMIAVVTWCEAVAVMNSAIQEYWAGRAKEKTEAHRNGDVLESATCWTRFRQAAELVKKYTQDLGAAQGVRRRLKQDMRTPAKVLEKDSWGFLKDPEVDPAVARLCQGE